MSVKDGKPALVNFQVHEGTYVVPKVLDKGYLALGKERFDSCSRAVSMADTPQAASVEREPPPAAVTDHRPVPRGVLPRRGWVMAGVAVGMLSRSCSSSDAPNHRRARRTTTAPPAPNADRVRDYQDRLRMLEAQAMREAQAAATGARVQPVQMDDAQPTPQDPIAADRKRREYESLFASNVVLSRRPERSGRTRAHTLRRPPGSDQSSPSIDDIADAVVRDDARAPTGRQAKPTQLQTPQPAPECPAAAVSARTREEHARPDGSDQRCGPLHRVLEGTVIDTVLTNRLDGSAAAPVNCLVTNPVYSHSGQQVVIPAGARVLGETKPVQTFGETGSPWRSTGC